MKDLHSGQEKKKYKERFLVHARNRLVPVSSETVAFFCKEEIIFLVTTDNQRHISDFNTLEEAEHVLNPAEFYRANRQYIIHLQAVESIRTHTTGKLTVRLRPPLQCEVDISREKAHSFREWLG
jgi:DNA-binding LytR/AlgR family response regulator